MSRTRPAACPKPAVSRSYLPKIFTSRAPATLNRSVMVWLMSALSTIDSREMSASLRPMNRAGSRNSGTSTSTSSVICHDRMIIAVAASTRVTALLTTCDRVVVKACWAPMTSVLSRETSEPVWVRVKKATG